MKNTLSRLAAATTLAFAAAAATPALATSSPAQPAEPLTPLILSCTSDGHAVRFLLKANTGQSGVTKPELVKEYLKDIEEVIENKIAPSNKEELVKENLYWSFTPLLKRFTDTFNVQNGTDFTLLIDDFGITHKPDPLCLARQKVTPAL